MTKPASRAITGIEGEWVITVRGKVVAHSKNNEEIFKLAKKYKDKKDARVTKIFHADASYY